MSRASSLPLLLEVPPSRRLQAGAVLFGLAIVVSLALAPIESWIWKPLVIVATALLAWHPLRAMVFQRGPASVQRFEWAANGTWHVVDATGSRQPARLARETAAIGPWVLLVWTTALTPGKSRRRYALIDAARVSPIAFRALRGRLKLLSGRREARDVHDNC